MFWSFQLRPKKPLVVLLSRFWRPERSFTTEIECLGLDNVKSGWSYVTRVCHDAGRRWLPNVHACVEFLAVRVREACCQTDDLKTSPVSSVRHEDASDNATILWRHWWRHKPSRPRLILSMSVELTAADCLAGMLLRCLIRGMSNLLRHYLTTTLMTSPKW